MTPDERLERRLYQIYAKASKELTQKANSYFARFERMDKQKRKQVEDGKLSEKEYQQWRQNRIMEGKRWTGFQRSIAETMTHTNEVAAAYMNGELPKLYAQNFNEVGRDAEHVIKGYSFDLTDANTVRNLSTSKKTLLPYKFVDGHRDTRWNTQKVNASILQSILQGEDLKQMTRRLATAIPGMNLDSARRNAQTAFTGAQNKGRLDGMKQLQDDGVIVKKEWLAQTGDGRTRDAHLELHHVQQDIDKPFVNSIGQIMFPGDPDADPANVYNCRCSIAQVIVGFKKREKEQEHEYQMPQTFSEKQYIDWQKENSTYEKLKKDFEQKYGVSIDNDGQAPYKKDQYIDEQGWLSDIWQKMYDDVYQVQAGYGHCGYIQAADGSKAINAYLRKGEIGIYRKSEMQKTIDAMNRLIDSTKLDRDLSVDRCAGINALEHMGIKVGDHGKSFRIGHCFCTDGLDYDAIVKTIKGEWIGAEIVDKGFMSASVSASNNIFGGSDVTFTIIAPKGTHAYVSDNLRESEIVFAPKTKQKIIDAKVTEREATDNEGKKIKRKTIEIILEII